MLTKIDNYGKTAYNVINPFLKNLPPQPARTEHQICHVLNKILDKISTDFYVGNEIQIIEDIMIELGLK